MGQLPFGSRESFRTDYASWQDFAFSFWLYNLDLRNKAPWFQNLSRFGELMTAFIILIHLILSFLLPEALYLFFAPVYIQCGHGKFVLLPFMD